MRSFQEWSRRIAVAACFIVQVDGLGFSAEVIAENDRNRVTLEEVSPCAECGNQSDVVFAVSDLGQHTSKSVTVRTHVEKPTPGIMAGRLVGKHAVVTIDTRYGYQVLGITVGDDPAVVFDDLYYRPSLSPDGQHLVGISPSQRFTDETDSAVLNDVYLAGESPTHRVLFPSVNRDMAMSMPWESDPERRIHILSPLIWSNDSARVTFIARVGTGNDLRIYVVTVPAIGGSRTVAATLDFTGNLKDRREGDRTLAFGVTSMHWITGSPYVRMVLSNSALWKHGEVDVAIPGELPTPRRDESRLLVPATAIADVDPVGAFMNAIPRKPSSAEWSSTAVTLAIHDITADSRARFHLTNQTRSVGPLLTDASSLIAAAAHRALHESSVPRPGPGEK